MKPRRAKPGSIFKLTYATIFDVVALPGGNEVLCARDADQPETVGMLERWNITTGERLAVFQGHTNTARAVGLAFDNTRAVSAGDDNTVRLWDLERASCLQVFSISARTLAVTDDSTHAIVADEERLSLVDLESGRQLMTFRGHKNRVLGLAVVPGRGQFVSASLDCSLALWDLASGKRLRRFDANPKRPKFVPRMGEENVEAATDVCVMAEGGHVAACYGDGAVRVWDLESGALEHTAQCGDGWLMSVAAAPHANQVLVGSWDHKLRVWQPGVADPLELGWHDGEVSAVAYLGDGGRAVSASFDETLRIWDVATGEGLRMIGEPRESGLCPPDKTLW